ncbi:hypothetical protein N9Z12_03265 [Opitutaceae bacterium]|nr:hypothetical protein [Opitutaceae bacterium]
MGELVAVVNDYDGTTYLSYLMASQSSSRYLSAIALFVAGFFAHALFLRLTEAPPPVEPSPADKTGDLEQEIRSLNDQLAAAQIENDQLSEAQQIQTPKRPESGKIGFTAGTVSGFGESIKIHGGRI